MTLETMVMFALVLTLIGLLFERARRLERFVEAMDDRQRQTARVLDAAGIRIQRIEVASEDPDRFAAELADAFRAAGKR